MPSAAAGLGNCDVTSASYQVRLGRLGRAEDDPSWSRIPPDGTSSRLPSHRLSDSDDVCHSTRRTQRHHHHHHHSTYIQGRERRAATKERDGTLTHQPSALRSPDHVSVSLSWRRSGDPPLSQPFFLARSCSARVWPRLHAAATVFHAQQYY